MQPLFLTPSIEFEKTAAMTQLPEDPNAWPHEILQELYKQAPYISDFSPHVVMEKVDGEQGYGLGHVEIGNQTEIQTGTTPGAAAASGVRSVRVPVVIKDGMLAPFDLLVSDDSKVLPLTEVRLRAAIFRPQAFDVTSRTPGDQSMIGQLYPPSRQSQGFGSGGTGMVTSVGLGKEGSALEGFLTKTAGEFEDFASQFLDADYLHAPDGSRHGRMGKKVASGEGKPGMLTEFVEKNAALMLIDDERLHADQPTARKANLGVAAVGGALGGAGLAHFLNEGAGLKSSPKSLAIGAGLGALATPAIAAYHNHKVDKHRAARGEKTASLLEAILPTINDSDMLAFKRAIVDPNIQGMLFKNAAAITPAIELLMSTPERPKFAEYFASLVQPSVVQLKRVDEGYRIKAASHLFWEPFTQTVDRGEAVRRFGEKVVLAADLSGAVTMADGAEATEPEPQHDSDMQGAAPVTEAGLYKVMTPEGAEAIGYVIPNLIDIDGTAIPLALFTNGSQATVQGDVVGVPVEGGGGMELPTGDVPQGRGVFASPGPEVQATIPLNISGSATLPSGETMYRAESFSGEDVMVCLQPNIATVVASDEGKMIIPDSWQWVPLDAADEIAVESQEDDLAKAASAKLGDKYVDIAGGSTFSMRGPLVEKLAHDEREGLGVDDAMFLLAGLGVDQDYGVRKLAEASSGLEPVRVYVGREIKLASDERFSALERARVTLDSLPHLKQPLFKEAAALGDPQAVDTVLSLGFLNPENLMTFVSYLPVLEDGMTKLCDILLASRLGNLIDTPEGAIERSVRSTEAVLEGLKALAFQNN